MQDEFVRSGREGIFQVENTVCSTGMPIAIARGDASRALKVEVIC